MNLREIVELVGGQIKGDDSLEITGAAGLNNSNEGDITYVEEKKSLDQLPDCKASAVLIMQECETNKAQIIHPKPALAYARLLIHFHPEIRPEPNIDSRAVISENVSLGKDVTIFPLVFIGKNTVIGDGAVLHPGVVIGDNCQIGANATIYANANLYRETVLGDNVIIHAGAILGADGFGYTPDEVGVHLKIPQIGRVVIEDDVEIGANTCIDRASKGDTIVKKGTKIDNQVQIAHNCTIGEHSIIVSQVGMSGSCTLGHHVILAGQVGLADHVELGDNVILAARSGTYADILKPGVYGGTPSISLIAWKKYITILPKLPELSRKINKLEKRLEQLEKDN
ncbi:MAG: UDP-3-O-(3-hydroxymyristoyl)glucosamine N-acyltransferase [Nitrospinales bacterium]